MTDTPYGVTGCRCWVDPASQRDEGTEDWTAASTCPYHGLLPRNRTDTGIYQVIVPDDVPTDTFDCRCADGHTPTQAMLPVAGGGADDWCRSPA
ncbi:hypothetical protein ACFCWY_20000 [Streptomyces sp. NPDC056362]|uniref:hypothetical protein n=1 Tax=unclassified Streptomyces TaxID=2593676 RepID=UPI0035DE8D33